MLIIENLNFEIDGFILNVKHLDLSGHKISAIMGPSGAGKTTLFHTLVGLYQPKNWSFKLNQIEMSHLKIEDRNLGIVFQNHELFPHLTAEENILIVMQARKADSKADFDRREKFKKDLKLEFCWKTKAENLSGGEAQRISLLRALISKPKMLLLDEPFSSLDTEIKIEARKLTSDLIQELDIPTLLITHDLDDARALNAHVVNIKNGVII